MLFRSKNIVADRTNLIDFLQSNVGDPLVIAGIIGGSLLSVVGVHLYKNFFSKNARSCSGSPDKVKCMKLLKIDSIKKSITVLNQSKGKYAKLPPKYKVKAVTKINNQIKTMQNKIATIINSK